MSDYARTQGGRVFHRSHCGYLTWAKNTPWPYADGKTPIELFTESLRLGTNVRPAKCCCYDRNRRPAAMRASTTEGE